MSDTQQLIEAIFADFFGAGLGKAPSSKNDLEGRVKLFTREMDKYPHESLRQAGQWFVHNTQWWPTIKDFKERVEGFGSGDVEPAGGFEIKDAVHVCLWNEEKRWVATGSKRDCIKKKIPYLPSETDSKILGQWLRGEIEYRDAYRQSMEELDRFDAYGNFKPGMGLTRASIALPDKTMPGVAS